MQTSAWCLQDPVLTIALSSIVGAVFLHFTVSGSSPTALMRSASLGQQLLSVTFLLANFVNCYFISSLRYISIWSAPSISPNCWAKSQPSVCEQAFLAGYKILTCLKCYRCLHCLICIYSCIVPLKKSVHAGVYFAEK